MVLLTFGVVGAQVVDGVPHLISYQGMLTDSDGNPVADGEYLIEFTIWSDSVSISPPDREWISPVCTVLVVNGLFNWQLGSREELPPWIIANHADLWLGIQVESDPELIPRTRLCSAPFAYKAWRADYAGYADSADISDRLYACAGIEHATTQSWTPPPPSLNANDIKLDFPITFTNIENLQISLSVVVNTGTCAGYPGRVSAVTLANTYAVITLQGWNGSSWVDLNSADEVDVTYHVFEQ
jgi:hypothetical protein